jgi:hypothetical protein
VSSCGPAWSADPGNSKSIDGLESHPPKGQGFLRNASSAKSQSILSGPLTGNHERETGLYSCTTALRIAVTHGAMLTVQGKWNRAVEYLPI